MYRTIKYQGEYTNGGGINFYKQLYSSSEATKRVLNVVAGITLKCGTSRSKRDHRNHPGTPGRTPSRTVDNALKIRAVCGSYSSSTSDSEQ